MHPPPWGDITFSILFAPHRRTERRGAHHSSTTYGKTTPSRSCRGIHNVNSTGEFPDRTDQQLSGDEITSSVRSINELAQHSYSHVISIYRRSFRRAGSGG